MTGSVAVSKDGLQYRFVIPGTRTTVWRLAASDAFLVDSSAPKPSTITTYKKGPAAYRTFFEAAPGSRGRKLRLDRRVARRQQITRRGAWRRPIGGGRPRCMNGHEDKRSCRRRPVSARARWRALHGTEARRSLSQRCLRRRAPTPRSNARTAATATTAAHTGRGGSES